MLRIDLPWKAAAVALLIAGQVSAAPNAASPSALSTAAAQQELQAIRKALVDEALDGPTRVRAWAWVDGQGALHERNEVSADMRVRGVRVREYVEKDKAPVLSIEAKQAVSATGQCRYAQGHWRLPMSVEVNIDAVRHADMRVVALASAQAAEQAWSDTLHLGQRYQTSARQVQQLTPYQRALLGAVDSESGWRAIWSVQAAPVAALPRFKPLEMGYQQTHNYPALANAADIAVVLQVVRERQDGQHAVREVVWQRSQALRVELINAGWSAPRLNPNSQARVDTLARQWGHDLERQFACEPLQYDVTDVRAQSLRINGGTAAGLQVGDRMVVMDAANVATQVWDTGSLEQVAIARVEHVDAYGAQLQAVAGAMPSANGRLVALPY